MAYGEIRLVMIFVTISLRKCSRLKSWLKTLQFQSKFAHCNFNGAYSTIRPSRKLKTSRFWNRDVFNQSLRTAISMDRIRLHRFGLKSSRFESRFQLLVEYGLIEIVTKIITSRISPLQFYTRSNVKSSTSSIFPCCRKCVGLQRGRAAEMDDRHWKFFSLRIVEL